MSDADHEPVPQLFRIMGPNLTGLPHTVRERQFQGYPSSIDEGPAGLQLRLRLTNGVDRIVDVPEPLRRYVAKGQPLDIVFDERRLHGKLVQCVAILIATGSLYNWLIFEQRISLDEIADQLDININGEEDVTASFADLFDNEGDKEAFFEHYMRGRSFPEPEPSASSPSLGMDELYRRDAEVLARHQHSEEPSD